jgi:hypothetical protein
MDTITVISTSTPPITPPIMAADGALWTPVGAVLRTTQIQSGQIEADMHTLKPVRLWL